MARTREYVRDNLVAGLCSPTAATWAHWPIAVIYGFFALAVGLGSGLLQPEVPSWFELLVLPFLLVLYPSLIEESVFRGLMLPRSLLDASGWRRFLAVTASTALFVLMHPVNAWFIDVSNTSQFLEIPFLLIVTALGYACGYLYLRSGSLWAPVALHWATVVAWNLFLGRTLAS